MIIEIEVGADEHELRSLAAWLRQEPSLRTATVSLKQPQAQPGEMGGWVGILQVVTDSGLGAGSFVLAVMTFLQTRRSAPPVTIRRGEVEVTLASGTPEEAARIAALLQQAEQHGAASDPGHPVPPENSGQGPQQ
ncbi:hypothetical protein ACFVDN_08030 [Streptomyces californicus]|uniref:effector-associated constant component EACC1 n=1 Tax=Streptomyces californicus TaxID=67351 RepID=UPI00369514AD